MVCTIHASVKPESRLEQTSADFLELILLVVSAGVIGVFSSDENTLFFLAPPSFDL